MKKIIARIARIARILENLINDYQVNIFEFMNDFNVSESTLQRDFNKVIQYLSYESIEKNYSIDMNIELKNFIKPKDIQLIATKIVHDDDPINQEYLENLFSSINKLPKRSDLKYKQIEKFKEYEMTYCIVHEMAIRNKRVIKLARVFHKLVSLQDKKNEKCSRIHIRLNCCDDVSGELQNEYNLARKSYYKCSRQKIIEQIFNILKNEYMISPLDCRIDGIDYVPWQNYTTLHRDYYTDSQIQSMIDGHVRLNTNQFNHVGNAKLDISNVYGYKDYDGFLLEQLKYNGENDFDYSILSPSFSRSIADNNVTTLAINFSLPKEEILAYITHLKDTLYPKGNKRKIKTPEEIARGEMYSSNFTKLKTVDIADYFFIYDYVTKRKDKLKENYIIEKVDNEEQVGYTEDIDKELVQSIFKDKYLKKQTKLNIATMTRYYYVMYYYINKLEYRELINSAFYKPLQKMKDGRLLSTDEQQQNRNQMIEYFKENKPIKEIALKTGMSLSRVYALKKRYDEKDKKLVIKKRGRTIGDKKISDELDNKIIQHLLQDGNKIWDKESTRTMIEQDLNTKLSISSVDKYLKTRQIRFDNCTEFLDETISIKQWIEYSFSQMISEAKKKNAIICWTDSYNRQEIQNNIYLTRLIIYPNNKFMFNLSRSNNSIDSLIEYLTILITQLNKMIFLIVDYFIIEHLNINDKEKIETFLQKNSKKIKIL